MKHFVEEADIELFEKEHFVLFIYLFIYLHIHLQDFKSISLKFNRHILKSKCITLNAYSVTYIKLRENPIPHTAQSVEDL